MENAKGPRKCPRPARTVREVVPCHTVLEGPEPPDVRLGGDVVADGDVLRKLDPEPVELEHRPVDPLGDALVHLLPEHIVVLLRQLARSQRGHRVLHRTVPGRARASASGGPPQHPTTSTDRPTAEPRGYATAFPGPHTRRPSRF
jgi:hypothetical protein